MQYISSVLGSQAVGGYVLVDRAVCVNSKNYTGQLFDDKALICRFYVWSLVLQSVDMLLLC